jgi:hypothetical protein
MVNIYSRSHMNYVRNVDGDIEVLKAVRRWSQVVSSNNVLKNLSGAVAQEQLGRVGGVVAGELEVGIAETAGADTEGII